MNIFFAVLVVITGLLCGTYLVIHDHPGMSLIPYLIGGSVNIKERRVKA